MSNNTPYVCYRKTILPSDNLDLSCNESTERKHAGYLAYFAGNEADKLTRYPMQ